MEERMAYKRIGGMDIYEIIRRWHSRQSITHIAQALGYDRKTVRKYIRLVSNNLCPLDKPLPPKEQVLEHIRTLLGESRPPRRPPTAQTLLEPYLEEITRLITQKNNALKPKIAFEFICEKYDLASQVSYSSFKRFVRKNRIVQSQKVTARIEVPPGSEVQIDYGYMGLLYDPAVGRRRKVYAFIGTLSFSRHQFVQFVFKQTKESFVASHAAMFSYFGGVPDRVLIDNLKSGVIKPGLYDPTLNPLYREMAEHYDIFIDPCRPGRPKDKGKTERQVQCVRQQFRKTLAKNSKLLLHQANSEARKWCLGKHGHRHHGTTGWQPYPYFINHEKPRLKELPDFPFEMAVWKQCTVHVDHYIQFNKKAFSLPTAYIGKKLWVKATGKILKVYDDNQLIKQHVISDNFRHTDWTDFPENITAVLDEGVPRYLQTMAGKVGPSFRKLVRTILQPHAFINLRKAQGIVSLKDKYDHRLLETAASLTLDKGLSTVPKKFVRLVETIASQKEEETIPVTLFTQEFVRPMTYFEQYPTTDKRRPNEH